MRGMGDGDQGGRVPGAWLAATGAVALATVLALTAPAGAAAPTKSKAKVQPTFAVSAAIVAGNATKADLVASFALPNGVAAGPGCKGSVRASAKVSGKSKSWTGKLKAASPGCAATIHAKLGKSALGKSTKVTFAFDGNTAIAKFKANPSLLIVSPVPAQNPLTTPQPSTGTPPTDTPAPPPAPPAAAPTNPGPTTPAPTTPDPPSGPPISSGPSLFSKGTWASDPTEPSGLILKWTVLADGTIPGLAANTFKWTCATGDGPVVRYAVMRFEGGLSASIDGSVEGTYNYMSPTDATNVVYTTKFKMTDNLVTGTMSAKGSYLYDDGLKGCHTSETFTGYHYGPTP